MSDVNDLDVARALVSRLRGYVKQLFKSFQKSHIVTLLKSFNSKGADVPLGTWLDFAEATKAALGPAVMIVLLCKAAVREAENQVEVAKDQGLRLTWVSKMETILKNKRDNLSENRIQAKADTKTPRLPETMSHGDEAFLCLLFLPSRLVTNL